ncbi:MAG TPA: ferredoxin [Kineosporiaceae bacterium]|nr:ferredoxin [Kineosporiaceae bacterium]
MSARVDGSGPRLRVDPVACDGIGMCAHVAPRLVGVDSWGYPVVDGSPLDRRSARSAAAAVSSCPRRALFLEGPAES